MSTNFVLRAPAEADPMKYNVGGIRISEAAFNRLRGEISLEECKLDFPRLWGSENIRYWNAWFRSEQISSAAC